MLMNHVMVAVTDMDRSVAFYEGLGFELIVRGSHDGTDAYARFVLPGDSTLSLHVDEAQDRRTTVIGLDCEGDLDGVNRLDPPWKLQ
jgi:catechol 2,3-dioxygenase-like lactoylglutathione lyase family enzyme